MARMKFDWIKKRWKTTVWLVVLVSIGVAGTLTYAQWKPYAEKFMAYIQNKDLEREEDEDAAAAAVLLRPANRTAATRIRCEVLGRRGVFVCRKP